MTTPTDGDDPVLAELRTAALTQPVPEQCELRVERGTVTLTELADSTEIPPELVADVGDWMRAAGVDELVVYRLKFLYRLAGYTFVGLGDLPSFLIEEAREQQGGLANLVDYATGYLSRTVRARAIGMTQAN